MAGGTRSELKFVELRTHYLLFCAKFVFAVGDRPATQNTDPQNSLILCERVFGSFVSVPQQKLQYE